MIPLYPGERLENHLLPRRFLKGVQWPCCYLPD
jgi:hypothetical protein